MEWSIITAVNNDELLAHNLLRSPEVSQAKEVLLQKSFSSAAMAYNSGIDKSNTEILVFVHQDVYLPSGWLDCLKKALAYLSTHDPKWGVLGVRGVSSDSRFHGHIYCTGNKGILGETFTKPQRILTLDEVLLVVRKSSGLRFDAQLPGFHFYGTDICLESNRQNLQSYVIPAFCIHNTNGYESMPIEFWQSYSFIRKKWALQLPIRTPCIEVSRFPLAIPRARFRRWWWIAVKGYRVGHRVPDPVQLYAEVTSRF
jgi:hypothetical protein